MGRLDVVGLGYATVDVVMQLDDMPTWERPSTLHAFRLAGGGPVATACVAAARLGARVGYVGTAGSDELGGIKVRSLEKEGVDVSRVVAREHPEDQVVIVYVDGKTGERAFAGVREPAGRPLRADELDRDYVTSAGYLHLDGCHPDAALQAARWMREAGKKVMIDGSSMRRGPLSDRWQALVRASDVLICGSGFGPALTGLDDAWEVGEAILEMGPRIVVQTEGARGSYTVTAGARFHVPAFEVDVVDTTGAGDVFHGAYLVGLLHGWDPETVAQFATAASAITCTELGGRSGIPRLPAVRSFLEQRGVSLPPCQDEERVTTETRRTQSECTMNNEAMNNE